MDWIKLHRQTLDSRVFSDDFLFRLFVWCLLSANWKRGWKGGREIPPGSFVSGELSAASQLNVSGSKWRRGMKKLAEFGCIQTEATNKFTIIKVVNWGIYQHFESEKGGKRRASDEQVTNNRRTSDEQVTTIEERKKERNERREEKERDVGFLDSGEVIPKKLSTPEFCQAWSDWKAHYREVTGRELGSIQGNRVLMDMNRMGTVEEHVLAINHSIAKGWRSIFPPERQESKNGAYDVVPFPDAV